VVAGRVLPPFGAAGLSVELFEGSQRRVVGAVGYSWDFLSKATRAPQPPKSPFNDMLRTRLPKFIDSPAEYTVLYPEMVDRMVASGKKAWAFLPLIASGNTIGCCIISFDEPRRLSDEERTLLTAVSGLVGQALARARMYDAEHARAQELQRDLLPSALPSPPGVTSAARYLPASSGTDV